MANDSCNIYITREWITTFQYSKQFLMWSINILQINGATQIEVTYFEFQQRKKMRLPLGSNTNLRYLTHDMCVFAYLCANSLFCVYFWYHLHDMARKSRAFWINVEYILWPQRTTENRLDKLSKWCKKCRTQSHWICGRNVMFFQPARRLFVERSQIHMESIGYNEWRHLSMWFQSN